MQTNDGRLISNVVVQALTGADITVHGDGDQTRSLCFVDDTIEAIIRVMRSDIGVATPINIGNPVELTVLAIVTAVIAATNTKSSVRYLPRPMHDPMRRRPDITRARTMLQWQPAVDFPNGLARTIDYFENELGVRHVHAVSAQ